MTGPRFLHVEGSPRGARSRTGMVARRLIAGLPDHQIELLDVHEAALPRFEGETIEGRYALIAGEQVDPSVKADWDAIAAATAHFLSFDGWIFTVPMWNFGIPWRLKQYIDVLTHPGLTFSVEDGAVKGLAAGKQAILIAGGALDIRAGGPAEALDFQVAYMKAWLGFIGVTDVRVVHVRPTYGTPNEVEAAMQAAYADADALAAQLRV